MEKQLRLIEDESNEISNSDENLIQVNGNLPIDDTIKFDCDLIVNRTSSLKIHNIGNPYPAKFIPEIPLWFLKKYTSEKDVVLDPFVGAGTTLVESALTNRIAYGVELNPLAVNISNAKSIPIKWDDLHYAKKKLFKELPIEYKGAEIPEFKNRDFWFTKESSQAIAEIREHIEKHLEEEKVKKFFIVTLSSVIRKVSHVALGQILPARRPNHSEDIDWSFSETIQEFKSKLNSNINAMNEYYKQIKEPKKVNVKALSGDARKLNGIDDIDHIITSPPYINAIHYIWANKLRLLQLKLIDDEERLALRSEELGTERIPAKKYKQLGIIGYKDIDKKLEDIFYEESYKSSQNKIIARSAYKYFTDMEKHFERSAEILTKGSKYCLVAGDNTLCGVKIPTANFLIKIAKNSGFDLKHRFNIVLQNKSLNIDKNLEYADDIDFDKVIVLEKN